MWMVITGGVLLLLGFWLLAKGLNTQRFTADPQALIASLKVATTQHPALLSGLVRVGIVCWIAGAMLLVTSLSQCNADKLKRCQRACQKIGYSQVKWVTFCRCIEGPKFIDLTEMDE